MNCDTPFSESDLHEITKLLEVFIKIDRREREKASKETEQQPPQSGE